MKLLWPKFDAKSRAYMNFTNAGPVVKEGLQREVCDLWMENQNRQTKSRTRLSRRSTSGGSFRAGEIRYDFGRRKRNRIPT